MLYNISVIGSTAPETRHVRNDRFIRTGKENWTKRKMWVRIVYLALGLE